MSIDRFTTNLPSGFSDAVTIAGPGRIIQMSGNVGFGDDGQVVSGGVAAEARATFVNLDRTLHELGADLSHIVKVNAYLLDLAEYAEYAAVRAEVFGADLPASTTVQVAGLLVGAQIEIDAVAFVPSS